MEPIKIAPSEFSPEVIINPTENIYLISGWSRPEHPAKFYLPILQWINEHGEKYLNGAVFEFKIVYFNTPSARSLRNILDQLDVLHKKGVSVSVNWYYEDMSFKEEFEYEFEKGLSIPIRFIENK